MLLCCHCRCCCQYLQIPPQMATFQTTEQVQMMAAVSPSGVRCACPRGSSRRARCHGGARAARTRAATASAPTRARGAAARAGGGVLLLLVRLRLLFLLLRLRNLRSAPRRGVSGARPRIRARMPKGRPPRAKARPARPAGRSGLRGRRADSAPMMTTQRVAADDLRRLRLLLPPSPPPHHHHGHGCWRRRAAEHEVRVGRRAARRAGTRRG